jgi:hypothetical protein
MSFASSLPDPQNIRTAEDAAAFASSVLGSVGSFLGPEVGPIVQAIATAVLGAVAKVADWLVSAFPAYVRQLNDNHIAELDNWVAQRVLGFPPGEGDRSPAALAGAAGWIFIYILDADPSHGICEASGYPPGRIGRSGRDLETIRRKFALLAGPRSALLPNCANTNDWSQIAGDARTLEQGLALFDRLAGGKVEKKLLPHNAVAFVGKNVAYVLEVPHDINPGYGVDNTWIDFICVNVNGLPDDLLTMLATRMSLEAQVENGSLSREDMHDLLSKAGFGTFEEAASRWHLYRYLLTTRSRTYKLAIPATLAAVGRRVSPEVRRLGAKAALRHGLILRGKAGRALTTTPKGEEDKGKKEAESKFPWAIVGTVAGIGLLGLILWRSRK